ncbi:MAG TPA: hypothetical protein VIF34_10425 [Methylocystis sp.]
MNRPSSQYEYMSLDDFVELLADNPADEKWERARAPTESPQLYAFRKPALE